MFYELHPALIESSAVVRYEVWEMDGLKPTWAVSKLMADDDGRKWLVLKESRPGLEWAEETGLAQLFSSYISAVLALEQIAAPSKEPIKHLTTDQ